MIKGFIGFDRFRSEDELKDMTAKAAVDQHGVFIPTHPLRKDGEVVGYFSIGHPGAIIVFAWLSTKDIGARDSFALINSVEDMVARSGQDKVCFPVPKTSPFHPLMEHMGYLNAGNYDFFIKTV
jgi:hypothetical protein